MIKNEEDLSVKNIHNTNRIYYLDLARVLAIISISLNHAVNYTYDNYNNQMIEFTKISFSASWVKTVAYIFSRLGVPLFLMITGALLLSKKIDSEKDITKFYKHNVLRLFITTEIWFIVIHFFALLYNPAYTIHSLSDVAHSILTLLKELIFIEPLPLKNTWYMPMILGLYTSIPFVIWLKQNSTKIIRKWLPVPIILVFVQSMLLPALEDFYSLLTCTNQTISIIPFEIYDTKYIFQNITMYYLYVIAGYCIHRGFLSRVRKTQLIFWIITSFVCSCTYQFWGYSRPVNYLIDYNFPLLLICAALIFELIRRIAHSFCQIQNQLTYISRRAFAVYFLHMIIMTAEVNLISFTDWRMDLKMLFLEISSLAISLLIISFLSKIHLIRKYFFMIK